MLVFMIEGTASKKLYPPDSRDSASTGLLRTVQMLRWIMSISPAVVHGMLAGIGLVIALTPLIYFLPTATLAATTGHSAMGRRQRVVRADR